MKALQPRSFTVPKFVDLTGRVFSRLTVLKHIGRNKSLKQLWICHCDCGGFVRVDSGRLVSGNTKSCGCYLKEKVTIHGGWNKSSYNTWRAMMRRCYNPKDKDFYKYGGQGVTVHLPWHEYASFVADMGEPMGDETLDRIDTYGNYKPDNCRWAGVKVQNRNTRVRQNNKTGFVGVSQTHSGTYMAKVTVGKKAFYSKCFPTIAEAAAARKELERIHWGTA